MQPISIDSDAELTNYLTPTGRLKRTNTTAEKTGVFIYRANKLHKGRYSYGSSVYGNSDKDKLTVTCKVHGDFSISANKHLRNQGCAECSTMLSTVIYLWLVKGTDIYKVGTTNLLRGTSRISEVASINRVTPIVLFLAVVPNARRLEKSILDKFNDYLYSGFTGSGHTEFLQLPSQQLSEVLSTLISNV